MAQSLLNKLVAKGTSALSGAATKAIYRELPPSMSGPAASALGELLSTGKLPARDLRGLATGAVNAAVSQARGRVGRTVARNLAGQLDGQDALALRRAVPGVDSAGAPPNFSPGAAPAYNTTHMMGGLTFDRALQVFKESANTAKSWKNLWHIKVEELTHTRAAPRGISRAMNLLALDVSFTPTAVTVDNHLLGAAVLRAVSGTEPVDLTITTYDDAAGSLARWFEAKADQVARPDGTFGLPAQYLVMLTLTEMDPEGLAREGQPQRRYWVIPTRLDMDLTRREKAPKELQMTFTQFDTMVDAT